MTGEEAEALGRRALAAGFEWRCGCVDLSGRRVSWAFKRRCGGLVDGGRLELEHRPGSSHDAVPDFRDAATRGVLLEQVRERWAPAKVTLYGDDSCQVLREGPASERFPLGEQLGRAFVDLVAALEGAPKR